MCPADTTIPPPNRQPVLIMMAHPRCPCTRASLEELSRLMTGLQGRLDARVVFFAPAEAGEEWWKSDLWEGAAAIPGVEVILDRDGAESQRFRTETSGHVLLYDTHGRLLFSGAFNLNTGFPCSGDTPWSVTVDAGSPYRPGKATFGLEATLVSVESGIGLFPQDILTSGTIILHPLRH